MPPLNKAPGTRKLTWTQSRILKAHSTIKIKVTKSICLTFLSKPLLVLISLVLGPKCTFDASQAKFYQPLMHIAVYIDEFYILCHKVLKVTTFITFKLLHTHRIYQQL